MTNKMPKIGENYRVYTDKTYHKKGSVVRIKEIYNGYASFWEGGEVMLKYFYEFYEELPTSNSQKPVIGQKYTRTKPVQGSIMNEIEVTGFGEDEDGETVLLKNGMTRLEGFFDRYLQKVERALEALEEEMRTSDPFGQRNLLSDADYYRLKTCARNLVNALEAERNNKAVISKPEPKIDMKEERVEPVSIWEAIYYCNFSPEQICLYENFINEIESEKKARLKLEERVRKLESTIFEITAIASEPYLTK